MKAIFTTWLATQAAIGAQGTWMKARKKKLQKIGQNYIENDLPNKSEPSTMAQK